MPSPEGSKSLSTTWEKIFDAAEDASLLGSPRGYMVAVPGGIFNAAWVYVKPLHGSDDPTGSTGVAVHNGQREAFYSTVLGGGGTISQVWARAATGTTTITHGVVHDDGFPD